MAADFKPLPDKDKWVAMVMSDLPLYVCVCQLCLCVPVVIVLVRTTQSRSLCTLVFRVCLQRLFVVCRSHSETVIQRMSQVTTEKLLISQWGQDAVALLELRALEALADDTADFNEYARLRRDLELSAELADLELDALAALPSAADRIKRKRRRQRDRIMHELRELDRIAQDARHLLQALKSRSAARAVNVKNSMVEGDNLFRRLGILTTWANRRVASNYKSRLLLRAHERGVDLSRRHPSETTNKFYRKITLSPQDRHPSLVLSHHDLTVTHTDTPCEVPQWGVVRASDTIALTPRYVSPAIRAVLDAVRQQVSVLCVRMSDGCECVLCRLFASGNNQPV